MSRRTPMAAKSNPTGTIPAQLSIHPQTSIGHVHLKVADLPRAIAFYRDALGFDLTEQMGSSVAFLSAGGYHHHIALNTLESRGGSPPAPGTTGLYHFAILYPSRLELARALKRLLGYGVGIGRGSGPRVCEG